MTSKVLESDDTNDKIAAYVSVLPQTSAEDQIESARQVHSWRCIAGFYSHHIQGYAHWIVSMILQGFTHCYNMVKYVWYVCALFSVAQMCVIHVTCIFKVHSLHCTHVHTCVLVHRW